MIYSIRVSHVKVLAEKLDYKMYYQSVEEKKQVFK